MSATGDPVLDDPTKLITTGAFKNFPHYDIAEQLTLTTEQVGVQVRVSVPDCTEGYVQVVLPAPKMHVPRAVVWSVIWKIAPL